MKNSLNVKLSLSCFFLLLTFISCNQDDYSAIGEDWTSSNTKVMSIDTLSVLSSTFKFDSIPVSGTNRLLIGSYDDPVFGRTSAESYVQLSNNTYTLDNDAEFDSIALILKYDGYTYNDTIPLQKFMVAEVLEDIEPEEDYYYNTTTFNAAENYLGEKLFNPLPHIRDSIQINVNDDYGRTMFEKLRDNDINSSDEFLREYPGLVISSDDSNTAILGFSKESYLRIYYSIESETEDDERHLDFAFNFTNSFHHIASSFSGTFFEDIEDQEDYLSSTTTEDKSYIQSGTGIATRLDFPSLERLNDIAGTGAIIEANLKVSLKQTREEAELTTRDSLQFYIINQRSEVLENLVDYNGNTVYGRIAEEHEEYNILTYTIPLKYYLDTKATTYNGDKWYLAMYPQEFASSVDRYIIYGEKAAPSLKLKLELIYAVYDE
ncbi:DUF4270 family protein [Zunongwangia sp. H14]|uniref:DUF4270 family protein n=1 Tax=Zunongwangia sp. H14 TaxID=3240792 RepID=UPI003565226A